MEKAIFSITCTTCQARLAVRSEAAVGAILECPRCQSMVHVLPPPTETPGAGPPPLDHVAAVPLILELELPEPSLLHRLIRSKAIFGGGTALVVLVAAGALWWALFSGAKSEPQTNTAAQATTPTVAVANRTPDSAKSPSPGVDQHESVAAAPVADETKRPATAVVGKEVERVADASKPPHNAGPEAKPAPPTSSLSTQPPRVADAAPPQPDPFPPDAEPAEDSRQVEIKKSPPAPVDVAARLGDNVAQLELTDMPLGKAVDLLASLGGVPITLDVDAMSQFGIGPRDPISVRLDSTTLGKALEAIVATKKLAVDVEGNQILVGPSAEYREVYRKVRYSVSDLTGDDKAAVAGLATLVQKLVAPGLWHDTIGRGTIETDAGALIVVQSNNVHQQVLVFCEKLRTARHMPLRSRESPDRFTLATRRDQARKLLDRPVTANFHEPTSLAKILAFLADAAGGVIVVDHAALAAVETSDQVEATLTVEKQPFATTLAELLRLLGLTYRVVSPGVVQVTSKEAAEDRLELEFYPVDTWLAQGTTGPALAERLKARVAASTWSDVGGPGEVYFDPPSECLIVLQSQPAQAAIERLLAVKGEGGGRKGE